MSQTYGLCVLITQPSCIVNIRKKKGSPYVSLSYGATRKSTLSCLSSTCYNSICYGHFGINTTIVSDTLNLCLKLFVLLYKKWLWGQFRVFFNKSPKWILEEWACMTQINYVWFPLVLSFHNFFVLLPQISLIPCAAKKAWNSSKL